MDSINKYFSDFIIVTNSDRDKIKTTDLLKSYNVWRSLNSKEKQFNQTSLNSVVDELGFVKKKLHGERYFVGIKFKESPSELVATPQSFLNNSSIVSKEVLESPKKIIPKKIDFLSQETIVPKKNFIKFTDFILHIPTFIAIKGSYPSNIDFLLYYPVNFNFAANSLLHDVHNLTPHESGNLYFNFNKLLLTMNEKNFSLENCVILLFSTGFDYAHFRFDRNLLVCNSYDDFYSYCKNNSLVI
jgi:hypothetical protein